MRIKKITVNVHEAKTTLSRLIEAAEKGHSVVIARDGDPVIELVPIKRKAQRRPGTYPEMRILPEFFETIEELEDWEKNL